MGPVLELVRKFYVDVAVRLEIEKANEIIQSDNPWKTLESFYFFDRYQKLIQNEHEIVNFTSNEKVVFIGGGPLPITLIMLNRLYGVQCISIEIIPEIAALSRKLIEKLGLSHYIKVIVGDETQLDNLDYNLVMVAAFAEPKKKVFNNIKKHVRQFVPLIYRTYTGMRAILYTPVTEEVIEGFRKVDVVLPTGNVNNTSVLIEKA